MTAPFLRFPDVQRVLVDDLETLAGVGHTAIETPVDLAGSLPFVRVLRIGGPSDHLNDHASIDIDVFAATYDACEQLAEQIRQHLVGPPPPVAALDWVGCDAGPREMPWGDGTIRRFNATYTVVSRRRLSG